MEKLSSHLGLAQSFLFAPGNRPEFFSKALKSASPAIILDLEDSVPFDEKISAREHIAQFLSQCSEVDHKRILVRMNPIGSTFNREDMIFLKHLKNTFTVMIPKAESIAQLDFVSQELAQLKWIVPLIESVVGFDQARIISQHPQCLRLALGNIDMQEDFGMSCNQDEMELLPVRFGIVFASKLATIAPPIDGVTLDINNEALLQTDTLRSKRLGFGAKLCIHPKQVEIVLKYFKPSENEILNARRVIDADKNSNGAAVQLDGKMVDRPVVLLAQRILRQSKLN